MVQLLRAESNKLLKNFGGKRDLNVIELEYAVGTEEFVPGLDQRL